MDIDKIKAESVGRWHGILNSLGIEVGDGKHGPCPICGGKDRFRFTDVEGKGTYYCNQCAPGDGFMLIQKVLGVDFIGACDEVGKVIGHCEKNNIPKDKGISREKMREIFFSSVPVDHTNPSGRYLRNRGLSVIPKNVRHIDKCWCAERKKECPAMLAIFSDSEGTAITMHRTYITKYGDKADIKKAKKLLPTLGKMAGGAIRLFEIDGDMMAIAEGIETAIAVRETANIPTWSVVSSSLMETFEPPPNIKHVYIFGDNDSNFAGHRSAYILANKLALKGIGVQVFFPQNVDTDFLDELNMSKINK